MKVAIVHDDLVQWGGAERVLEGICEIYPDAPIFTSVYDADNMELRKRFGSRKIITSFLQKIPGWKNIYKPLFFLYPIAFEQFDFSGFDLVISHTTRFAKSIITKPQTKHICYCYTPPRFLWNYSGESQYDWMKPLMDYLRKYDRVSANRVDFFLAGSKNASRRIKEVYGMDSRVVYPFIDLKRFERVETYDGGYFVVISRLNKYKRVDLAVKACGKMGLPLKVIGTGPEMENLKRLPRPAIGGARNDGVDFLGNLSDEMVVSVLTGCRALIIPGIEDFGLTSLETQALGKPVIAVKGGGVLETVIEGKTGLFFSEHTMDSLIDAINRFNDSGQINKDNCIINAKKFKRELFITNFKQTVASLC